MNSLYSLTGEFLELLEMAGDPEVDGECLKDTMEAIGGEIEDKAENYAKIIKTLEANAAGIDVEIKRLTEHKRNEAVEDVIRRKEKRGVPLKKMDFLGSYKKAVDTKRDLQEIIGNICGAQHDRFRDECILAKNNGIQLYVLVENEDGIKDTKDLNAWENPRVKIQKWVTTPSGQRRKVLKYPHATKGDTLAKAMDTMEEKYGVKFLFCHPDEAGERVLSILAE